VKEQRGVGPGSDARVRAEAEDVVGRFSADRSLGRAERHHEGHRLHGTEEVGDVGGQPAGQRKTGGREHVGQAHVGERAGTGAGELAGPFVARRVPRGERVDALAEERGAVEDGVDAGAGALAPVNHGGGRRGGGEETADLSEQRLGGRRARHDDRPRQERAARGRSDTRATRESQPRDRQGNGPALPVLFQGITVGKGRRPPSDPERVNRRLSKAEHAAPEQALARPGSRPAGQGSQATGPRQEGPRGASIIATAASETGAAATQNPRALSQRAPPKRVQSRSATHWEALASTNQVQAGVTPTTMSSASRKARRRRRRHPAKTTSGTVANAPAPHVART